MLSSCLALPREGHLLQLFRMFSYLEKQHNCEMVFDHAVPAIDKADFWMENWDNLLTSYRLYFILYYLLSPLRPNSILYNTTYCSTIHHRQY